jgi:nucleotide-binding universal stress UspA family protein
MRLLVAVDLTEDDAAAFVASAAHWAQAVGGTVDLLFVDEAADQHPYVLDPGLRATMSTHYKAWHTEMREALAALLQSLPEEIRGTAEVVRGRAAPVVLEHLEGHDAVVLGNRPATGLARLAHGVVAERVSRQSAIPVLILPRSP